MSDPIQLPYDPRKVTEVRYPESLPEHILLNKVLSQLAIAYLREMANTSRTGGAMVTIDDQRYCVWVDEDAGQLRVRRVDGVSNE